MPKNGSKKSSTDNKWWDSLSPESQRQYLKDHQSKKRLGNRRVKKGIPASKKTGVKKESHSPSSIPAAAPTPKPVDVQDPLDSLHKILNKHKPKKEGRKIEELKPETRSLIENFQYVKPGGGILAHHAKRIAKHIGASILRALNDQLNLSSCLKLLTGRDLLEDLAENIENSHPKVSRATRKALKIASEEAAHLVKEGKSDLAKQMKEWRKSVKPEHIHKMSLQFSHNSSMTNSEVDAMTRGVQHYVDTGKLPSGHDDRDMLELLSHVPGADNLHKFSTQLSKLSRYAELYGDGTKKSRDDDDDDNDE